MKRLQRTVAATLAALTILGSARVLPTLTVSAAERTYSGTAITEHIGGYDHYDRTLVTHTYDFSLDRIGYYAVDPALALGNRAAAEIVDGRLTTKDGMDFTIGSAVGLGDDYGLEEGFLHFDLSLTGGTVYLGLRTSMPDCQTTDRGIWFTFDGSDKMRIYEPECGLEAIVPMPVALTEARTFSVHEGLSTLTLTCGETTIASVKYTEDGYLAICGADGAVLAETSECELYPSGYFELYLKDIDGYVDNISFTNVESSRKTAETDELRVIDYSTWTATDAIDRTVADNAEAGDPKDNRYVGLFYFLCWVGAGQVVSDNTRDYLEYGAEGIKQRIEERGGEAYWAEPYFGYYRNTDTWVYRKHAYMLEAAGVDFIFLDVSNNEVFIPGHTALFDTWLEMRNQGIDTPQIVFFNGDTTAFMENNMRKLMTSVYSDENWDKYKELFFEWEGKPLVFGNMSGVSADMKALINEKFTVRGSWAWQDQDNYWSWIQEYIFRNGQARLKNGGWGRDASGRKEALSIAMGHHPTTSKGRSFVNGVQPDNGLDDFEFSSVEQAGKGLGFGSQFNAVTKLVADHVPAEDPFVLMITGWNEWIAGGFTNDKPVNLANTTCKVSYVDQFNCEFSRDGEPMRNRDGYGIGDNYYYQMVDYIRRYKGINETPIADHQGSIDIYDLSSWDAIELSYLDSVYDTEHRNTICYDPHYRYINNTGRNDLASAKVSQDESALYFLVTAAHDIVIDNDADWMNLYINTDGDTSTGWAGYDYVLNRARDSFVVTVEKFQDNTYETEVVGGAYYYLEGDSMAVKVQKSLLGLSGKAERLIFKWADNADVNGDPMAFMDRGDTAPNDRFGFLYLCEDYTTTETPAVTLMTDATTAAPNGSAITDPGANVTITVKPSTVDVLYDFNKMTPGMYVTDTVMAEQFEHHGGTNDSVARVLKGEGKYGNYVRVSGFSDLRTWNNVEGSYEFSADVRFTEYGNSAIYVRGEMPGAYAPTNPKNFNVTQVFNYYEWDWYAENGGRTFGSSSTAGSGIGIYPGKNDITVRIKRYAEDGLGVASASHTFKYSESFSPDDDGWFKLRVVDDEKTVSIYFNDVLMASVKLSNPGVVYESDGTGQPYYGEAILCDAAGKEVLTVENTRINSRGSQIAFTTRAQTMEFANVYIAYEGQVAEGSHVSTALTPAEGTVAYTPDTALLTTLRFGQETGGESGDDTTGTDTSDAPAVSEPFESETEAQKKSGCASVMRATVLWPMLFGAGWLCIHANRNRRRDGS